MISQLTLNGDNVIALAIGLLTLCGVTITAIATIRTGVKAAQIEQQASQINDAVNNVHKSNGGSPRIYDLAIKTHAISSLNTDRISRLEKKLDSVESKIDTIVEGLGQLPTDAE